MAFGEDVQKISTHCDHFYYVKISVKHTLTSDHLPTFFSYFIHRLSKIVTMEKVSIAFSKFFHRLQEKGRENVSREFHNDLLSRSKNIKLYQSVTILGASPLSWSHLCHAVYLHFTD